MATTSKKTKKTEPMQTWNQITGTMKVYGNTFKTKGKKEFTKWSVSVSGKRADSDEWVNYYIPVKFRGDAEEPDTDGLHTVEVSNAFLSAETYTNKEGVEIMTPCMIITACELVD